MRGNPVFRLYQMYWDQRVEMLSHICWPESCSFCCCWPVQWPRSSSILLFSSPLSPCVLPFHPPVLQELGKMPVYCPDLRSQGGDRLLVPLARPYFALVGTAFFKASWQRSVANFHGAGKYLQKGTLQNTCKGHRMWLPTQWPCPSEKRIFFH